MKIAFASYLYPTIKVTGGGLYTKFIVNELKKNHHVDVFIPEKGVKGIKKTGNQNLIYKGVPITKIPFLQGISFEKNIRNIINDETYDIIHVNASGGLFLKNIDVFTCHHLGKTLKKKLHYLIPSFSMLKAKKIITVSNYTKKKIMKRYNIDKHSIKVIPNGINPKFLHNNIKDEEIRKTEKNYDLTDKKSILYINSNLSKRKNTSLMFKTAKYIKENNKDFRLIIVCKEKYKFKLNKLLKQFDIYDITNSFYNLSDEELIKLYHISDFLAMPSFNEGFGFPLIETLAVGHPFVSFKVGVANELNNKGYGFIAKNSKDFKEKCLELVENPIVYDSSKTFIKNNYSWESSVKKLLGVYEGSLGE